MLNNVSGVFFVGFPGFLLINRVWDISPATSPASHWLEDFAEGMPIATYYNKTPLTLCEASAAKQANQLLAWINSAPPVISIGTDQNKPLTL
jgi:hypothetical protein